MYIICSECVLFFNHVLSQYTLHPIRTRVKGINVIRCGASMGTYPSGPGVIKLFSCSTQMSTKFQLLIKLKYRQIKKFLA